MPRLVDAFEQFFSGSVSGGGPSLQITYTSLVGSFVLGETVTGGTSAATGVVALTASPQITCNQVSGEFQVGETITGGTSGATATTTSLLLYNFPAGAAPLANGLIDFYESGSTTVRKTTYADSGETIANANPLVLNGDGRV